jgi:acyl carrier protein
MIYSDIGKYLLSEEELIAKILDLDPSKLDYSFSKSDNSDIRSTVINVISEQCGIPKSSIKSSSILGRDLKMDEFDIIESLQELEDSFSIHLPDYYLSDTVGDIINKIRSELKFIKNK